MAINRRCDTRDYTIRDALIFTQSEYTRDVLFRKRVYDFFRIFDKQMIS